MSTITRCVVCVAAVLAILFGGAERTFAQQNFKGTPVTLSNSNFETGSFTSWVPSSYGTSVVTPGQGSSNYCGQLQLTGSASTIYLARNSSNGFPQTAGWYRMTFWMKTNLTQGYAGARVYSSTAGNLFQQGLKGIPKISGNSNWTQYSIVYQVPSSPGAVTLFLEGNNMLGTVQFDNLSLETIPSNLDTFLPNNGFETGTFTSWLCLPNSSFFSAPGGNAAEGAYCGQIYVTNAVWAPYPYLARTDLPTVITDGGYYRITYWMKTALTQGKAGASIYARNSGGGNLAVWSKGQAGIPVAIGTTDWTQYSFVYQLPANTASVVLQLETYYPLQSTDIANTSTISFDKVIVEGIDQAEYNSFYAQQTAVAPNIETVCGQPLEQPCRVSHPMSGCLYNDPGNGAPMLALNSCVSPTGSAILIDYTTPSNPLATVLPSSVGGWATIQLPNQKLLFDSMSPNHLSLVQVSMADKVIELTVNTSPLTNIYAWQFAKGSDNCVYYGSYPTCHAYKYDSSVEQVTDLGTMDVDYNGVANSPINTYVRYIGVTGDGWVLSTIMGSANNVNSGVVAWKPGMAGYPKMIQGTKGLVPKLMTVQNLLNPALNIVYAWGGFTDGKLKQFNPSTMLFTDATLAPASLPNPPVGQWKDVLASSTSSTLIMGSSGSGYYYKVQGATSTPIFNRYLLYGTGDVVGIDSNGKVVGYRGQSFFTSDQGPNSPNLQFYPIVTTPSAVPSSTPMFIRADPDGGVTGAANFGNFLFRYVNPANWVIPSDPAVNGDGEIYDGRWYNGKFYFVVYSTACTGVWDPALAWDPNNTTNPNPRKLAPAPYIRPLGGIVQNPTTNKFYSGWVGAYWTRTGGLVEVALNGATRNWAAYQFDPQNDPVNAPVSMGCVASGGNYVYGLTSNFFDGITSANIRPLTFWMFDPAGNGTIKTRMPVGVSDVASCFYVPGTGRVWLVLPTGLRQFTWNGSTGSFGALLPWPAACGTYDTRGTALYKFDTLGSNAWICVGNTVVQLHDGPYPWVEALFMAPSGLAGITANGADNKLYVASDVNLYSLTLP